MGLLDRFRRKLTPARFAALLMDRIKAAGDTREIRYDEENFYLSTADGGAITNLHNLYAEYERADDEDREKVVRNFLAAWFTTEMALPESFDDAKPDLLLSIRSRAYYEVGVALMSDTLEPNDQLIYAEIAGCLAVSPIYDLPTSIRSLSAQDLSDWGVTLYEALEVAKQNLRETTREVAEAEGLYLFASGDSHDAARLVLTDLIGGLDLAGEPIAVVPNREMLLVTGSENEQGLQQLAAIAAEGLSHERGISGVALRLTGDEWTPWRPPAEHPAAAAFSVLRAQSLAGDYAQQKALLEKRHQRDKTNLFVAPFEAVQDEATGHVRSYTTWVEGVDTLLPVTDQIVFLASDEQGNPTKAIAAGDWDKVEALAGQQMAPVEGYPERVRVRDFPEAEALEQIGLAGWVKE